MFLVLYLALTLNWTSGGESGGRKGLSLETQDEAVIAVSLHHLLLFNITTVWLRSRGLPGKVHRIKFHDEERDRVLVFLTNNTALSPLTIARLYKCCWRVELFSNGSSNTCESKHSTERTRMR